jgi:hypothetical protein
MRPSHNFPVANWKLKTSTGSQTNIYYICINAYKRLNPFVNVCLGGYLKVTCKCYPDRPLEISNFTRIFADIFTRIMTTKLTLTIDDSVISIAKKYAKQKGKSLSDIVENYLMSLTSKENKVESISPKILKLMGAIKLPEDYDYKKELTKGLLKKYKS